MPDASITALTWDQLRLSPHNVRVHQPDAEATDALEKSLLAEGQLMPLVVHPFRGNRANRQKYGVLAGGRRYRAFGKLLAAGKLPADHPIAVKVREGTDAALVAASLAENMIRKDLRGYEEHAGVAKLFALGQDESTIAAELGQDPQAERLDIAGRLAQLRLPDAARTNGVPPRKPGIRYRDSAAHKSTITEQVAREAELAGARRSAARSIQTVSDEMILELDRPAPAAVPSRGAADRRPFAQDRSPCPHCGTRGDLGCAHRQPNEGATP